MKVRIARGEVWVEGLSEPVNPGRDGWTVEGAFEIEKRPEEELRELSVLPPPGGTVRGGAAQMRYRAVFVSGHQEGR